MVASYLTPPQVARQFGIDAKKITGWIRRGELKAVNLATTTSGRPRWKISPADLEAFLAARSAGPMPKVSRQRRRKTPGITEYF